MAPFSNSILNWFLFNFLIGNFSFNTSLYTEPNSTSAFLYVGVISTVEEKGISSSLNAIIDAWKLLPPPTPYSKYITILTMVIVK